MINKYNIKIKLKSIKQNILEVYLQFLQISLKKHETNFSVFSLPIKKQKITLLKSPHVYKKAREQFELTTYSKIICIKNCTNKNLVKFLLYNKPSEIKSTIYKIN